MLGFLQELFRRENNKNNCLFGIFIKNNLPLWHLDFYLNDGLSFPLTRE